MKKLLLLLITFVSFTAQAQYNYEYGIIYFDEYDSPTNVNYRQAELLKADLSSLKRNDDIRADEVRLSITQTSGNIVEYKMTESFATSVENDMVDSTTSGVGPVINNYGPFQFEIMHQEMRARNSHPRNSTFRTNRIPRRWQIYFEFRNDAGEWYRPTTSAIVPFNRLPTNGYNIDASTINGIFGSNADGWRSINWGTYGDAARIVVEDEQVRPDGTKFRTIRQVTRLVEWE